LQKGLEAPVGEEVVDEQPLAVGVAVPPEADDVPVSEPADEPHVSVERLAAAGGELQSAQALDGHHDAVLEHRLVRAPGHALAEHLGGRLEEALQPQLLAPSKQTSPPLFWHLSSLPFLLSSSSRHNAASEASFADRSFLLM
jgi:hypothetical protein